MWLESRTPSQRLESLELFSHTESHSHGTLARTQALLSYLWDVGVGWAVFISAGWAESDRPSADRWTRSILLAPPTLRQTTPRVSPLVTNS